MFIRSTVTTGDIKCVMMQTGQPPPSVVLALYTFPYIAGGDNPCAARWWNHPRQPSSITRGEAAITSIITIRRGSGICILILLVDGRWSKSTAVLFQLLFDIPAVLGSVFGVLPSVRS